MTPLRAAKSRRYVAAWSFGLPRRSWLLVCLLATACSGGSQVDVPDTADDSAAAPVAVVETAAADQGPIRSASATGVGLDPSNWTIVSWNATSLESPVPESEASLHSDANGLVVRTYKPVPPVHLVLRRELEDNFEVELQVIRPSLQQLRERQIVNPTTLHPLVGFRPAGRGASPRAFLEGHQNGQQAFDAIVRGSQGKISVWVNGDRKLQSRRGKATSGRVFIQLHGPTELHITGCEIREIPAPDPDEIVASEEPASALPAGVFPGAMPPFAMPGPMFPGFGPPQNPASAPSPSRNEPLMTSGDWFVPKLDNPALDTVIAQDLRLTEDEHGIEIAKTAASGSFWIVRTLPEEGDFAVTLRVSLPPMNTLVSGGGGQAMLAFGVHPQAPGDGLTVPSPPPLPAAPRELSVTFRRVAGQVSATIDGLQTGYAAKRIDGPVLVGLLLCGGIQCRIVDVRISPEQVAANPRGADSAADTAGQPAEEGDAPTAPPARKRIWTERAGQRKIEAEFVRLEGERIRLRKDDGREFSVPLEFFIDNDQRVARQLGQQGEGCDEGTR